MAILLYGGTIRDKELLYNLDGIGRGRGIACKDSVTEIDRPFRKSHSLLRHQYGQAFLMKKQCDRDH